MSVPIQAIQVDSQTCLFVSATPEGFAAPQMVRAKVVTLDIRRTNDALAVDKRSVLHSSTGRLMELGTVIKTSIYGHVVRASLLQRDPEFDSQEVYRRNGELVAIKVYKLAKLRELQGKTQENPLLEIPVMQCIGGDIPSLMGQLECCMDEENIFVVMRYLAGGELFDYIENKGPMPDQQAREMFHQVLKAVTSLQRLGVAHRDMSLENILYDGHNAYVVIDYGMAVRLRRHGQNCMVRGIIYNEAQIAPTANVRSYWQYYCAIPKVAVCGKRNYIAPEVLSQEAVFHPMLADMWALGIILFIALTGMPPVDLAMYSDQRYELIANGQLPDLIDAWGISMNPLAVDLLTKLLVVNPLERPLLEDVMNHPWLQQ